MTEQTITTRPQTPLPPPAPHTPVEQRWGLLWALAVFILILFFLVALFPVAPNVGFAGPAAVLSIITAVAVGIERIIEGFWTIIGLTKGAFWPLNLVNEQVNGMVNNLDDKLRPVYEDAEKAMNELARTERWADEKLAEAKRELEELKARTTRLKALAPDNQRVNMIAASAFQSVSFLEKKYPQVSRNAEVAQQAIIGVSDFVATFKDNPGRRLISILLGMILGLCVAGVIRLDLFEAAGQTPAAGETNATRPATPDVSAARERKAEVGGITIGLYWGVAFTGLLMGLGSNPTHEVIRAIQEYKKTRKSDNDPAPVIPPPGGGAPPPPAPGTEPAGPSMNIPAPPATPRWASRGVDTFSLRRRY